MFKTGEINMEKVESANRYHGQNTQKGLNKYKKPVKTAKTFRQNSLQSEDNSMKNRNRRQRGVCVREKPVSTGCKSVG